MSLNRNGGRGSFSQGSWHGGAGIAGVLCCVVDLQYLQVDHSPLLCAFAINTVSALFLISLLLPGNCSYLNQ